MSETGHSRDIETHRVPAGDDAALGLSERDLAMRFESLGGTGHGCEFGLFQRHFGAEPLGLLRWADLSHHLLTRALESRFDGVGLPENTIVFNPAGSDEWWTKDTRVLDGYAVLRQNVGCRPGPHDGAGLPQAPVSTPEAHR